MKKMMSWLADSFAPTMKEFFSRPWLSGISSSMQKIIPFILAGSLIYCYNVVKSFIPSLPDLSPILNFSFGIITLIITFMIANQCMEKLNHPEYVINAGLTSIGVLLLAIMPVGSEADSIQALLSRLGPTGIAVGMVVGIFVSIIFNLWAKLKFLKDSSIPDFVTSWINTIIPMVVCLAIAMVLVDVLGLDIFEIILGAFEPVAKIGQTLPGFILICLIPAFFYTMGVSSWLWGAVTTPIFMSGIQANIDAVAQGQPALNIVTSETVFTMTFITMGGMCATLALNVLMCFSKSNELKMLGRIFIVPSFFNINEPIMFGAPVVFNPLLMIPSWINAIIGPIYVWIIMKMGLLNIPDKMIQVGQIPAPFSSVMVTEDFRAVLWWLLLFVIYLIIWYPFFKVYEKEKIEGKMEISN
ncbi:PTS transporter subunit EIIC [Vagococcus zengguangii]|uniref:Permease IIC component n=1 Tax=Vagococcus zengguangii TaxID=2571750 RepID=A0A4D7CTQ6_9ENTE|nr:PTS transporter subunit EIIC [Vagococcus zengguangii]QCI86623.1 PTS sugar transporter subunit IIC [Vagococcus zengguangii]TLG79742.1 PTS sugar transporter subunit IIC [Vagococcus zengguangii]